METIYATDGTLQAARRHYAAAGLLERLKDTLKVLGPEDRQLTVSQLSAVDQFHTRGLAATVELARLADLQPGMRVLDVGSGMGGPARFIAENFGCFVAGVDLSEAFVEAARYLTERTGQTDHVTFKVGNALDLPVGTGEFDIVIQQHVAMNIADRPALYREMSRIVKPGGRFAIYDVVLTGGDPIYPLPWSTSPEGSFLMSATDTCTTVEEAGFRTILSRDDSEAAKAWISQLQSSGPVPPPNLGTVMGPNFGELATNLGRALLQGRLGLLMAVFEAE